VPRRNLWLAPSERPVDHAGRRRRDRHGNFRADGRGGPKGWSRNDAVVRRRRVGLRRHGALLRGARLHGSGVRIGLHLLVCGARRTHRLDRRWALILEYTVAASAVAVGVVELLRAPGAA